MVKYNNCVVYQIYCKDEKVAESYIGSTTDFKKRKIDHKTACNNPNSPRHNLKIYKYIRDNGGWNNFECKVLEECKDINSKDDLHKIERKYIEQHKTKLNVNIPTRKRTERYNDNREKIKKYYNDNREKIKKYYIDNREEILLKANQKFNCECGGKYTKIHQSRHSKSKIHQKYLSSTESE